MPVKCPKREKHEAWPLLADGAQIWADPGSTARATHRSLRLSDTFCSICDRAIRLRAQLPTTLLHHHHLRRESVPLIRPPFTLPAPACGLARVARPCTLRLTCARDAPSPRTRLSSTLAPFQACTMPKLRGTASYCTVASSNMTCTA
jgi:hypothetical protein